ncbi:MAG: M67 family metallopeptidase [Ignavibacteriales bacterium]|nr:M67 family metallopeptidase [Ignavibacteriales bacterium]
MQAFPEECCGVLLGRKNGFDGIVVDALARRNSHETDRTRRFLVTPAEYKFAEVEAKKEGVDIIGFYHSHPNHPPKPSAFDLQHALPWWSYVIVSVDDGRPGVVKSWVMREDRSGFEEEEILVGDGQLKHSL